jgi:hypothetical protein
MNIITIYDTPGYDHYVTVSGNYAYVATSTYELMILDISDIQNPYTVGVFDSTGYCNSIYIQGEYAYLALGWGDIMPGVLAIIDISDPGNPILVGDYWSIGAYFRVCVEGNFAYVISLTEFGTDFPTLI